MSRIKVDPKAVTQAGVDMGAAANTIREVLSQVVTASQPVNAATLGGPHSPVVFDAFWTHLRQQVQLSGDVFAELGKRMGGAAVHLQNADTNSANGVNSAGNTPAATTPTTPSVAPAGADNNPTPVTSDPPPPDPTGTGGDPNGGTISAPGSATGT
jgi:uncharacterized protein YukE